MLQILTVDPDGYVFFINGNPVDDVEVQPAIDEDGNQFGIDITEDVTLSGDDLAAVLNGDSATKSTDGNWWLANSLVRTPADDNVGDPFAGEGD